MPLKHPLSPSPRFPVNVPTSLNPATSDQGLPFLSVPLTYHSLIPPYPRGTGFSNVNGNKGIACGLNNLQKIRDGEPLGGKSSAESDFATDDDDDFLS